MEGTLKVLCVPGPREKAVTSQEPGEDLRAGLGGSPGEAGWLWLTVGTRTLVAEVLGSTHWHELS